MSKKESKYDLTPSLFKIPGTEVFIEIVKLPQWKKVNDEWVEQTPADYMKVAQRLVWFNLEKKDWIIETDLAEIKEGFIQAKCTIKDPTGKVMRTAHKTLKYEGEKDWDSIETGAVGRALAMLGYGTQFASNELEEADDQPVDAPTTTIKKSVETGESKESLEAKKPTEKPKENLDDIEAAGDYVIEVGVDAGKTIRQLWLQKKLRDRVDFLEKMKTRTSGSEKLYQAGKKYLVVYPQDPTPVKGN